jgi:hypothetical protein
MPESPSRDELVATMDAAFRDTRRGRIGLREGWALDRYADASERTAMRAADKEVRIDRLSGDVLQNFWDGLRHVDPASWVFYLGAYMKWAVTQSDDEASVVRGGLVYMLTPERKDPVLRRLHEERFDALTPKQVLAVVMFLRHMEQSELACHRDATVALIEYWNPRAASSSK